MKAIALGLLLAYSGTALAEPSKAEQAIFAQLAAVPSYQSGASDPAKIIAAVNALQPLGRDRGAAVLRDYFHSKPANIEGAFLVMRALFVPKETGKVLPPMRVGAPDNPPSDKLPAFPLAIVDDLPLLVINGYALGGEPEPPEMHLAALLAEAAWRAKPLAPHQDAFAIVDDIAGKRGTPFLAAANLDTDSGRARILDQGLRAMFGTSFAAGKDVDARWAVEQRRYIEFRARHPVR